MKRQHLAVAVWLIFGSIMTIQNNGNAAGHGPLFGLATPTLSQGGWSLDWAIMWRNVEGESIIMTRPMIGYGITEDLLLSVSLPMPIRSLPGFAASRAMAMMPGAPDIEFLLGWRFHRQAVEIGARFESTAYLGFDYPTDNARNSIPTYPGLFGGLVTGYASRSIYFWGSVQGQRYMSPAGDNANNLGDQFMYSLVIGYRPPFFREDYPRPDWRIFLELSGGIRGKDKLDGVLQLNTGGHQIFLAPTLLGLYGAWGISFGPAFAVYRDLNGAQATESLRIAVNCTYWF